MNHRNVTYLIGGLILFATVACRDSNCDLQQMLKDIAMLHGTTKSTDGRLLEWRVNECFVEPDNDYDIRINYVLSEGGVDCSNGNLQVRRSNRESAVKYIINSLSEPQPLMPLTRPASK